ncbi:amidohydrolase family protein [Mucilaginibacter agri]|uniref:Amidohydrolase family protein n=1 Tax=Mucilaginibacter agri TaxID=2695265 RepID=A0A965ZKG4_9SPHI|nr:amidohydrolase family protein [Mucilaginibacter agri]NCD71712.1 amidohydrolase family protein [Mucilaginibacter agri]
MHIDAHQHFWTYNPIDFDWITDDMANIRRDFLPADLEPVLKENGIDGCVSVQAEQTESENEWLLAHASENPFIKGVVGWVDLRAKGVEERLAYYSQVPAIKGFRHILQAEPDRAFMLQPDFKRGISLLKKYNFTYDILINSDQLGYSAELVKAFPNQKFVVDHIAKPNIRAGELENWAKQIRKIALFDNVSCKVSGMVTEASLTDWKKNDFTPYLDVVSEAFGPKRLLYGSDWPVCLAAASYEQVMTIVTDYFSVAEQELIFGMNAVKFYNL